MPSPRANVGGGLLPLVDVVFLLLIFFMLTFSLSSEKVINIAAPNDSPTPTAAARLLLTEDGGISLNGEELTLEALTARLGHGVIVGGVHIQAERGVLLERLVEVMEKVALSGSEVAGIAVQ